MDPSGTTITQPRLSPLLPGNPHSPDSFLGSLLWPRANLKKNTLRLSSSSIEFISGLGIHTPPHGISQLAELG